MAEGIEDANRMATLIPAHLVARVLLVEPFFERSEIIEHGRGIHLSFARESFQRVGPRTARSHGQYFRELCASRLVAVDRAAVQRAGVTRLLAQGTVKLEL